MSSTTCFTPHGSVWPHAPAGDGLQKRLERERKSDRARKVWWKESQLSHLLALLRTHQHLRNVFGPCLCRGLPWDANLVVLLVPMFTLVQHRPAFLCAFFPACLPHPALPLCLLLALFPVCLPLPVDLHF
ncbi:hypothetical protein Pcinc_020910 [Petrolisthes cinctipes]|uniref:Uncharacterized protein n=1 Tax=Petrolisthes cinctipes TaxID=88211 RepID=A0AAE1FGZ5_PETCI|nr:hypothetical protein Pcinc_020910 [Petrolisthes cinctipes]